MSIKKTAEYQDSKDHDYAMAMAELKRDQINVPKTPLKKMTEEEIQAMQSPATRANLNRTKPRDWNEPYAKGWQAERDAEAVFAATGHKATDIFLDEARRHKSKNEIGQSEKSGVSDERKAKAVEAYMAAPGVKLEDLPDDPKVIGLLKYFAAKSPREESWESVSIFKAFWSWVRGKKVRRVDDEK